MNDISRRCPGCMRLLDGGAVCPVCGTPAQFVQTAPFLPLRTPLLQGRFGVGCVTEQNGDGITYLGLDGQTNKPVYIREFFPAAIAVREQGQAIQNVMQGCEAVWQDCAQNFMELWRKLERLRGLTALISVTDVFEENSTIYAAYEYSESMTFRDFLLRGKHGYISWERARTLLMPVLSALGNLHQQGILHRGISPSTLLFGSDGKVRVSGFSIWQARTAHGDLTADLASGYTALEQYSLDAKQGPWTDIYAFAAVVYRTLIGSDPDDAVTRRHNDRLMVPAQFAEHIPAYVINALINAMKVFPEDRTRTVEYFRAELSASPSAIAQAMQPQRPRPAAAAPPPPGPAVSSKRHKASGTGAAVRVFLSIVGAGALILAAVVGIGFRSQAREFFAGLRGKENTSVTETTASGERMQVPLLENRILSDTLEAELSEYFTLSVVYQSDEFAPEGQILKQSLPGGGTAERGAALLLTVSEGRPGVVLPEVADRSIADVRKELEALGFVVTVSETANSDAAKTGTVKSVVQTPGQEYPKSTEIFIQIWGDPSGTPVEQTTAPQTTVQ